MHVGKVDYIIAYTWGSSTKVPKEGGTLHTWQHSTALRKIHIPLQTLLHHQSHPLITLHTKRYVDSSPKKTTAKGETRNNCDAEEK